VVDGDGYFFLRGKGNGVGLAITVGSEDLPLLEHIQSHLGAGIIHTPRMGNWYRYRVQKRAVMQRLCKGVNGHLRNGVRLPQFRRICAKLEVSPEGSHTPPLGFSLVRGLLGCRWHRGARCTSQAWGDTPDPESR
jgi:hypothetical protein